MQKNTNDRRARRSRKLLKDGLLALMKEKDFKDITARDIAERADLNRGTFYLHYADTSALLASIEDDIIEQTARLLDAHREDLKPSASLRPLLAPMLEFVEEKRETIELLLCGGNAGNFHGKMKKLLCESCMSYARDICGISDEQKLCCFMSYTAFGILGLVAEWSESGMKMPKEKLIDYADALVRRSAQA